MVRHWHRLLRKVGELLFLELFKKCGDVVLRNTDKRATLMVGG